MRRRRVRIGTPGNPPAEATSPRRRRRRRSRRMATVAVVSLLLVAGTLAAAQLGISRLVDRGILARWAEARVEAALSRPVSLEGASFSLLPRPTVTAAGVVLEGPPTGRNRPPGAVDFHAVRLDLDLRALSAGELQVRRVILDGPVLGLGEEVGVRTGLMDLVSVPGGGSRGTGAPADPAPGGPGLEQVADTAGGIPPR